MLDDSKRFHQSGHTAVLHKHSGNTSEYRPEAIALKLRAAGVHDIALEAGVDLFVQVGANLDPLLLAMRFFKLLLRPKVRIVSSGGLVPACAHVGVLLLPAQYIR